MYFGRTCSQGSAFDILYAQNSSRYPPQHPRLDLFFRVVGLGVGIEEKLIDFCFVHLCPDSLKKRKKKRKEKLIDFCFVRLCSDSWYGLSLCVRACACWSLSLRACVCMLHMHSVYVCGWEGDDPNGGRGSTRSWSDKAYGVKTVRKQHQHRHCFFLSHDTNHVKWQC